MAFGGLKKWFEDRAKNVQNIGSKAFDQINTFDNNRTWEQRTPTQQKSAFQQAGQFGGQLVRGTVGGGARLANTAAVQIPQVSATARMLTADLTNNREAWRNANQSALRANERFKRGQGGILNTGTLYNADEAKRGDFKTGITRIGGGTLEAQLEAGSFGLGGFTGKQLVKQGFKQGIKSQLPTIAKNAVLNTAQGGVAAANQGASGRDIAKSAALGGVLGTAGDVGLGIAGAGITKGIRAIPNPPRSEAGFIRLPSRQKTFVINEGVPVEHPKTPLQIKAGVPLARDPRTPVPRGFQVVDNSVPPSNKLKIKDNSVPRRVSGAAEQAMLSKQGAQPSILKRIAEWDKARGEGGYVQIPKGKSQRLPATDTPSLTKQEQIVNKSAEQSSLSQTTSDVLSGTQKSLQGKEPLQTTQTLMQDTPYVKTRGFVKTVLDDPNTDQNIKQSISSVYKVRNTKELQTKASNLVKDNPDLALRIAQNEGDDVSVAITSELMKKLQSEGNFEQAVTIAQRQAEILTKAGQTSQAASIYGKLSPEGILRFTQKEINKYNLETGKNIQLGASKAKQLTEMAKKIESMPDGYEKTVAIKKLVNEVQKTMPATLAQKLSTLQTMAQLLNPKTNIRNVGGNSIFAGLENISQTIATPVDKLLSTIRGTARTTSLPSIKTQLKSASEGGRMAVKEAYQGINTGNGTQFELNEVPVFRDGALGALEKTMNATLQGADRAAYKAAYDDTIRGLLKANNTKIVTPDMLEQAHLTGLYRTFQDTNALSEFFTGMKKSLNKIGIGTEKGRFGLGDLVLKYPKTPANLLARGIDYSPVGFVKSVFEASKPLFGKEFDQKAFVDSFSRAVVGTGSAFGVGFVLADNGIITAQPEQNKDLRNVQKTAGLGGYQINASALKRWVASGFNKDAAKLREGDTLVSYDWAQPIAIPISAGAAAGSKKPTKAGADATNTLIDSTNTLVEQPLLQGLQRAFGGSNTGLMDSLTETVKGLPSSFTPTILGQANQLIDNTTRNTKASNPVIESINQVKAKIPGVAQTLPNQVDVLGNDKERYQNGSNTPFNVLLNPAFVSKYTPNNTSSEALGLYNRTGETKQTPNTVKDAVKINGKNIKLDGQQQADYQRFVGQGNNQATEIAIRDPRYQKLSDTQKVNLLANLQTDINNAAKIRLFGDKPDKVSESVQSIADYNLERAVELKLQSQEKTVKVKSASKNKTSNTKKTSSRRSSRAGRKVNIPDLSFKGASTTVSSGKIKAPKVVSNLKRSGGVQRRAKVKVRVA